MKAFMDDEYQVIFLGGGEAVSVFAGNSIKVELLLLEIVPVKSMLTMCHRMTEVSG